jgi:hypothetical protein
VGGKIEKNEMSGACGVYRGGERCVQGVGGETRGKEGDPDVDGRIILRLIFRKLEGVGLDGVGSG